jgi:hypothetical protein
MGSYPLIPSISGSLSPTNYYCYYYYCYYYTTTTTKLCDRFSLAVYQSTSVRIRKHENVLNFILKEKPGNLHKKIPPTITFLPFNRFWRAIYMPIDSAQEVWMKMKPPKSSNFILGVQPGYIPQNLPWNNLLTVQPILASDIPIDSAIQPDKWNDENLKRTIGYKIQWRSNRNLRTMAFHEWSDIWFVAPLADMQKIHPVFF